MQLNKPQILRKSELSFNENVTRVFTLFYGVFGSFLTLLILGYYLYSAPRELDIFFYFLLMGIPILFAIIFFALKGDVSKSAMIAYVTITTGNLNILLLDYEAYLSITVVFLLSALFIVRKLWQAAIFYSTVFISVTLKLIIERFRLWPEIFPSENMSDQDVILNLFFLLSIFTYSALIYYLIYQGLLNTKKLEVASQALKESIANKNRFLALMSHDLKGPLGMTRSIISAMKNKTLPPSDESLDLLEKLSSDTNDLLKNLILWSKIQKDRGWIEPRIFDIAQCINESIEFLENTAGVKQISVQYDSGESFEVYADRRMISTVVRNLISNSIKFSHENSSITIKTAFEKNQCKVTIYDKGVGISQSDIRNIFSQSIEKISSVGTANEKGAGMGLILAKDFVEANQGSIGASSSVGKGSEFWFTIPLSKLDRPTH